MFYLSPLVSHTRVSGLRPRSPRYAEGTFISDYSITLDKIRQQDFVNWLLAQKGRKNKCVVLFPHLDPIPHPVPCAQALLSLGVGGGVAGSRIWAPKHGLVVVTSDFGNEIKCSCFTCFFPHPLVGFWKALPWWRQLRISCGGRGVEELGALCFWD